MSKKPPPIQLRHLFLLRWKLIAVLAVIIFVFALSRLWNSEPDLEITQYDVADADFDAPAKIAFLFLAKRNLPLDFLWGSFFENGDVANFSIYVHSEPGFVFDESTTKSPFFYGRQLKNSIRVGWGESSMIQAERLLFRAALEDPANQKFVLLSDSCVPLYNFSHIYNYVMASSRSFVDSFLDTKGGRYNPKMSPTIPQKKWRKGSQWATIVRRHAKVLVNDRVIFPSFQKFCKRRPPVDLRKGKLNTKLQKQHNCIPDEHYVQTLLAMRELEGELERRTLTYTLWNESTTATEDKGWHPMTFGYTTTSPQQIKDIKDIKHVYYESEFRTEWCKTNATNVPCFLFARKFSHGAAMRLLNNGVVGSFDQGSLLDSPCDLYR